MKCTLIKSYSNARFQVRYRYIVLTASGASFMHEQYLVWQSVDMCSSVYTMHMYDIHHITSALLNPSSKKDYLYAIIPSLSFTLVGLFKSFLICCTGVQYFDSISAATFFSPAIGDLKAATTASQVGLTDVLSHVFSTSHIRSDWSFSFCLKQSRVVCGMFNSSPILYQLARTGWSSLSSTLRFGSAYARNYTV